MCNFEDGALKCWGQASGVLGGLDLNSSIQYHFTGIKTNQEVQQLSLENTILAPFSVMEY